ncbi:2-epi-5-epi-valiolone synthase [Bradyrhizobium sp. CB1717]|uniref:3-dehydroquinate synthase family protein n=1 Tax=Bradyrhizobium sp. CB1717 TaxID=3039154 RepID=UPI0024B0A9DD|nr:2-epi-5-epi-valiolone synthase [Bradyrhizobium sp. CB1717]WFU25474.1 2-epi-5-epi-valiolone synthase [Bradyrhizobium sp. CB1717]
MIDRQLALYSSYEHSFVAEVFGDLLDSRLDLWIQRHIARRTALVVTTPTVNRIYREPILKRLQQAGCQPRWIVKDCYEGSKVMELVLGVCEAAVQANIDRGGVLIALGGGVCSDIVTLASSLLRRGISHVRIPTTLIGQIDAGIGLKGGVNFGVHKNYLGCFYPPDAVAIIPSILKTLSADGVRQGLAEMIKVACTSDTTLFKNLETARPGEIEAQIKSGHAQTNDMIRRAICAMIAELSKNPFERKGYERAVDFGHTLAHPLEASTGYTLHHGMAVAVDLAFSALLSRGLGWLDARSCERIIGTLRSCRLPLWHENVTEQLIHDAFMTNAKHRGGEINMTLPTGIGTYAFLKNEKQCPSGLITVILNELRQRQKEATAAQPEARRTGF